MDLNMKTLTLPATIPVPVRTGLLGLCLFLSGAGVCYGVLTWGTGDPAVRAETVAQPRDAAASAEEPSVIRFETSKWLAAGIKIEPAVRAAITERIWRTGKVALNQDRLAKIHPLVEGIVREVKAGIGQDVRAGEVLAVIDSKELGQAKLDLVKNRLALHAAEHHSEWIKTISGNVEYLLEALTKNVPLVQIEKHLRGRAVGEWRQKLVAAYARREQFQRQFASMEPVHRKGGVSDADFRKAKADFEAAAATYQALWDDIKHESHHQLHEVEQKLREAETAVTISATYLMMMGYTKKEVESMNPVVEGERVSYYAIRAPFAGTVIAKQASYSNRIGPQSQAFVIADLSTVRIEADVPEADMDFLHGLAGKKVRFKPGGRDGPVAEAVVKYSGDLVDKDTRAVTLGAEAANPERRLKPGMFIDVELSKGGDAPGVQVPASAVQRAHTQTFVFVQQGEDEFRRVDVTVGRKAGDMLEISAGLAAGDRVVTQGTFALKSEMLRSQLKED
jgi:multidrug efflux pump subunit AcrA (membrane-fusion protein)